MRRIVAKPPVTEWWNEWLDDCQAETASVISEVEAGRKPKFTSLYRKHKNEFLMASTGPFRAKCAYCERDLSSQHGDVEHYRPKGATHDEDDRPIRRRAEGAQETHPGYYWLAYDWKNLLPSCQICNTGNKQKSSSGKPGKRNRFPVLGDYAWSPGEEVNEDPLLLNPTIDDLTEHLFFDERTGVISWGSSDRGEMTVRILGLNDYGMPGMRADRYRAVKALVRQFYGKYDGRHPDTQAIEDLQRIKDGHGVYTAFALKAIEDVFEEEQIRLEEAHRQLED